MEAIIVTIPKSRLAAVEKEEAQVARAIADGERDIIYYWTLPTEPVRRAERIYFVWNGAMRAYHDLIEINHEDGVRAYMKPEIHHIKPVPMKGFRGWRYYQVSEPATK